MNPAQTAEAPGSAQPASRGPKLGAPALRFPRSRPMQRRAHWLIPGGCHTYAKGDDQFPELAPGFIARGLGAHVWDVDGHEYIEYGMGLRSVTLGHAHPRIVAAAAQAMQLGTNFTRPAAIEVACAEALLNLIQRADMVKFTKDGSTANTAAVKLARAYTGRNKVAICSDHPFFSYDDWFIGTTAIDTGIPQSAKDLTLAFPYNDLPRLEQLFDQHPDQIACVILEPARHEDPVDRFLHRVQNLCHREGAVMILDEMITGFRWDTRGAQHYYDITPDLSTWGKALANGFALSALAGRREIMEQGGLHHDGHRVFLLSTTHGAETHALAAALETMRIYQEEPIVHRMWEVGARLAHGLQQVIDRHALTEHVQIVGKPCSLVYVARDVAGRPSQEFRTLLLQETIRRGVIAPSLFVSAAHSDCDIEYTIDAFDGALHVYRRALADGVEHYMVGRPSNPVYVKRNPQHRPYLPDIAAVMLETELSHSP